MPRKEHRTTPLVIGHTLYTQQDAIPLDTPAWFDWLAHHTTFYLDSPLGSFTARQELRGTSSFWYAFRRYHKHLFKAYLGRSADLTTTRLLRVAQHLAHKAGV